jgi:fatty-acyl-CoA synthase
MTETSPVSFQSSTSDSVEQRVSTVGRVHPHVQVRVIDEQGNTVPRGVQGELLTRGYPVMQGHWDDVDKTKGALDSAQWMHTGDLAVIDEHGYGKITGRLKDMVIRGGENIYPKEIEDFFYANPKVMDVAAFGVPNKKYGEELCIWV